jgi:hypothetical protein
MIEEDFLSSSFFILTLSKRMSVSVSAVNETEALDPDDNDVYSIKKITTRGVTKSKSYANM